MKRRASAFVILALAAVVGTATAYVLNGPKWGVTQIPFYINPVNSDMPDADALFAIQTAAANWTTQSAAGISWSYMGRTSGSSLTQNSKNEMFFRSASAGSMAAETLWWYDGSYRLIEADIVFYDGGFVFVKSGGACSGGIFLEDIATHEFGHALGLGHSTVSTATMYPSISYCSTALRSLETDDIAGILQLYPSKYRSPTAPTNLRIVY